MPKTGIIDGNESAKDMHNRQNRVVAWSNVPKTGLVNRLNKTKSAVF